MDKQGRPRARRRKSKGKLNKREGTMAGRGKPASKSRRSAEKRGNPTGVWIERYKPGDTRSKYYITFRDPRQLQDTGNVKRGRRMVKRGLGTADTATAEEYRWHLGRIISDQSLWDSPPEDCPQKVLEIWLGEKADIELELDGEKIATFPHGRASRNIQFEMVPSNADFDGHLIDPRKHDPSEPPDIIVEVGDYDPEDREEAWAAAYKRTRLQLENASSLNKRLRDMIDELESQNRALRHKLKLYAKRAERLSKVGTLREEADAYIDHYGKRSVHPKRKGILKSTLNRFVEEMGPDRKADDVTEEEVARYVETYRTRNNKPIGEERRKAIRLQVCTFLESATHHVFARGAVRSIRSHTVARTQKPVVWLERGEAEALVKKVYERHGDYWGDVATLQLRMAWRPSELILLQKAHVTEDVIQLVPVEDPDTGVVSAKTGARSVKIPMAAKAAVKRRLAQSEKPWLFPAIVRRRGQKASRRKTRDRGILKDAWTEDHFLKQYRQRLREAAESAEVTKPICCRTLRRTCGSLLLRDKANRRDYIAVAAVLGSSPKTVRRHYARLEAEEVSTEIGEEELAGLVPGSADDGSSI